MRIQIKRDTAANWTKNNPVLLAGEFGYDTTNRLVKIGDGATQWGDLSYCNYDEFYAKAKAYTDSAIKNLIGSAPETLDTIYELAEALQSNKSLIDTLNDAIAKKVDKVTGKGLSTNDFTNDLKTKLGTAYDHSQSAHAPSNAERNIIVGIQKNGADVTVDSNRKVNITVPTKTSEITNDSGFITSGATTAKAKQLETARKIDGVNFDGTADITHYGTCSTAAGTAAKTVAVTGFNLVTGARVTVKFTVTNTAASPTLNVNGTGAKAIKYRGSTISTGYLAANRVYEFVYDGTDYLFMGDINIDTNTTYKAGTGITIGSGNAINHTNSVTAGTVKGDDSKTLGFGSTFKVPSITYDAQGHITSTSTTTMTMPATPTTVSGNAGSATKLATARNFSITGGATASAISFNGTADVALNVTSLNAAKLTIASSDTLILDGTI